MPASCDGLGGTLSVRRVTVPRLGEALAGTIGGGIPEREGCELEGAGRAGSADGGAGGAAGGRAAGSGSIGFAAGAAAVAGLGAAP